VRTGVQDGPGVDSIHRTVRSTQRRRWRRNRLRLEGSKHGMVAVEGRSCGRRRHQFFKARIGTDLGGRQGVWGRRLQRVAGKRSSGLGGGSLVLGRWCRWRQCCLGGVGSWGRGLVGDEDVQAWWWLRNRDRDLRLYWIFGSCGNTRSGQDRRRHLISYLSFYEFVCCHI
jgi:hypothetical protein